MELDRDAVLWNAPEAERTGRPLLVLLHGLGSHEADLFGLAPYLPREAVVASVRAPLPEPPGFAWFPRSTVSGRPDASHVDVATDALLDWLSRLEGFASVGLLGFSQGGVVAVHTLRRDPDAAAYAINLAGFTVPGEQPGDAVLAERRPPVFWGRGARDEVIPADAIERTAEWLPAHSTLQSHTYPLLAHAVSEDELADVTAFLRARLPLTR